MSSPSSKIRSALQRVDELRCKACATSALANAVHAIKSLQSQRFATTYQDLLGSRIYSGCADFFLTELYSERNYEQRDRQFAKVAGVIEATFPKSVIGTTVELAQLHELTESLDLAMAAQWLRETTTTTSGERYRRAWQQIDCTAQRLRQLDTVVQIGQKLGELTRRRGLQLLLKMMRRPAEIAGLVNLHIFLETGFQRFSQISRTRATLDYFLATIEARETEWIRSMEPQTQVATKTKTPNRMIGRSG